MRAYLRLAGFLGLLISALVTVTRAQIPPEWATVTGQVLDSQGLPVPGAKISVFPMDVGVSGGMPGATTDDEGRYRLVSPAYPGRTRLCAVKESAGYPDTQSLLFVSGNDTLPEVSLPAGGHVELDIHLGAPDGILQGSIIDARTRATVSKARIKLHRDQPESIHSTSVAPDGHFLFALPPAPIDITVVAPGYRTWKYQDSQSKSDKLVLSAPDHRRITVELIPR
jgi:carboxypeptidase family protein